jgi:hypothetical protein
LAPNDIVRQRLWSSRLAGERLGSAEGVVDWLCAVQAQDYAGAKWAIAQRTTGVTEAHLDQLFDAAALLRTHVLRPTWHIVRPADIRWLLQLTGPRVKAAIAYYDRLLELDSSLFARANLVIERALAGGVMLTRAEVGEALVRSGVVADNQRVGHLLMHAELDGVVCSGVRRGRRHTYALLEERVPPAPALDRQAALATLARRYFSSHGPAQLRDFAWWSGLALGQVRSAVELAASSGLERTTLGGAEYFGTEMSATTRQRRPLVHLIPNWDEYLVGYADRSAHVAAGTFTTAPTSLDLLANSVIVDGRVVGGWRRTVARDRVVVTTRLRVALSAAQHHALLRAGHAYGRFLQKPLTLVGDDAG